MNNKVRGGGSYPLSRCVLVLIMFLHFKSSRYSDYTSMWILRPQKKVSPPENGVNFSVYSRPVLQYSLHNATGLNLVVLFSL